MKYVLTTLISLFLTQYASANDCFEKHGKNLGINPDLLRAIALVESGGRPNAVSGPSHSQDLGLMQINAEWISSVFKHQSSRRDFVG